MLEPINVTVDLQPIIDQVNKLSFDKRLALNFTNGKLLNGPYKTKPEFVGTPLGDLLEFLGNPGEARLLKLDCAESYTVHADPDDRLHLAIITNPHAYLIDCDNHKMYHLPADGNVYKMDTSLMHVASNFGARPRIHLNIRVALPAYKNPGYRLKITSELYDWKQESYTVLMSFFNKAIKNKIITGFEKVNDAEVLINCDPAVLSPYIKTLKEKGFTVSLEKE